MGVYLGSQLRVEKCGLLCLLTGTTKYLPSALRKQKMIVTERITKRLFEKAV
jgi:hypothetical protein